MRLFSRLFASDLEKRYRKIVADAARQDRGEKQERVSRGEAIERIERSFEEDFLSADIKSALGELRSNEQAIADDSDSTEYPATPCLTAKELQILANRGRLSPERMKHVDHCALCEALQAKSNLVGKKLDDLVERLATPSAAGVAPSPAASSSADERRLAGERTMRPAHDPADLAIGAPSRLQVARLPLDRRDAARSPWRLRVAAAFVAPLLLVGVFFLLPRGGLNWNPYPRYQALSLATAAIKPGWYEGILTFPSAADSNNSNPGELVFKPSDSSHGTWYFDLRAGGTDASVRQDLKTIDDCKNLNITATANGDKSGHPVFTVFSIDPLEKMDATASSHRKGAASRELASEDDAVTDNPTWSTKSFKTPSTFDFSKKVKFEVVPDDRDPKKFVFTMKCQDPVDGSSPPSSDGKSRIPGVKKNQLYLESMTPGSAAEKRASARPPAAAAPAASQQHIE